MACETIRKPKQTLQQRKDEVLRAVERFNAGLVSGAVKVKVGPQGAISFDGVSNVDRDGVTDACVYRRLMLTGSPLAKMKIAQAEQLAGRSVDRKVLAHGVHSHDHGKTWHSGH